MFFGLFTSHDIIHILTNESSLPEDNVLEDGTLIDLSGAILLWRSGDSLSKNLTLEELAYMVSILNQTHMQCPVLYRTLRFDEHFLDPSTTSPPYSPNVSGNSTLTCATFGNRQPFVYLNCGHVHGWHPWRHRNDPNCDGHMDSCVFPALNLTLKLFQLFRTFFLASYAFAFLVVFPSLTSNDRSADRTCPLCRQTSRFVQLTFGEEVAFYVDHGPPTHCFNPCGHIASEATVR
ncbi:unnamed protein product [Dibothriocephalus latus]|uniref:Uncharacterized protein n=1 Tax=Dibothriocephalus latus TaxID=60516 RepID=A0A3P6TSL2_DIBLA|nr:unnamed protein product [Dibothriocephalus latus]